MAMDQAFLFLRTAVSAPWGATAGGVGRRAGSAATDPARHPSYGRVCTPPAWPAVVVAAAGFTGALGALPAPTATGFTAPPDAR